MEEEEVVSHAIDSIKTLKEWKTTLTRVTVSKQTSLLRSQVPWIAQIPGLSRLEKLPPKQQLKLGAWPGARSSRQMTTAQHIVTKVMNEVRHEIRSRRDKTVLLY